MKRRFFYGLKPSISNYSPKDFSDKYLRSRGRVHTSHQAAMSRKEMIMAEVMLSPI